MSIADIAATLSAQNTFTDWVRIAPGQRASISIAGLSDSTVTLQRRMDRDDTPKDYASYTASEEIIYEAGADEEIRAGIKTGAYGTDTVAIRIKIG